MGIQRSEEQLNDSSSHIRNIVLYHGSHSLCDCSDTRFKEKMTSKQYLSQLKKIEIQIRQLMSEKEFLEGQLVNTSIAPKEIQVLSSLPPDPMADRVARIVDLEKEIDAKVDKLIDLRMEIVTKIHSLDSHLQIQVLYKRYVEYKRWDTIMSEMHYSYPHLMEVHRAALKNIHNHT